MQVEVIPMLINSDFMNVPLDKLLHLADYKMYGEDSYVFQQKELLHGLYECTYLSMNDKELSVEALEYLLKNNKNIGEALSSVYGIERNDTLSTLPTMSAVLASSTAMSAVAASSTAMSAVAASSTAMSAVAASSTAMSAVAASSTAMSVVAASSTAMSAVLASSTAMSAVLASSTAMSAVLASSTAMSAVLASSTAMSAVLASSTAMSAVAASSTAMSAVLASSTAMSAVLASSTAMSAVAASSTAMSAVAASSTAMSAVAASSTAMSAVLASSTAIAGICKANYDTTKEIINAINNNNEYIKKVYDIVTTSSDFKNTTNICADDVISLNRYCNIPDTIIFCALGYYKTGDGSTSLFINNKAIKTLSRAGGSNPQSVNRNNCSAIAVPTATFTENRDGYAAIAVYQAI